MFPHWVVCLFVGFHSFGTRNSGFGLHHSSNLPKTVVCEEILNKMRSAFLNDQKHGIIVVSWTCCRGETSPRQAAGCLLNNDFFCLILSQCLISSLNPLGSFIPDISTGAAPSGLTSFWTDASEDQMVMGLLKGDMVALRDWCELSVWTGEDGKGENKEHRQLPGTAFGERLACYVWKSKSDLWILSPQTSLQDVYTVIHIKDWDLKKRHALKIEIGQEILVGKSLSFFLLWTKNWWTLKIGKEVEELAPWNTCILNTFSLQIFGSSLYKRGPS